MTASPEHEARIRAIGNAALEMLEAWKLIGDANGLSPEDAVTALTLAADSVGKAVDVVAEIKELARGSHRPL